MRLLIITSLLSIILMFDGCLSVISEPSPEVTAARTQNSREKPGSSAQRADFLHSGIFDRNPKALEAWLRFVGEGKYRVANADDFAFSDASKKELQELFGEMWYPRINHPAISGNISRKDWFYDLAVIVVDTTRTDPRKFGLIIFNVPKETGTTSAHWLFRERDLSSALLSWHSNWPVIVFYHIDGSSDPLYINWNQKTEEYFLDKEQKDKDARQNSRLFDTVQP